MYSIDDGSSTTSSNNHMKVVSMYVDLQSYMCLVQT